MYSRYSFDVCTMTGVQLHGALMFLPSVNAVSDCLLPAPTSWSVSQRPGARSAYLHVHIGAWLLAADHHGHATLQLISVT